MLDAIPLRTPSHAQVLRVFVFPLGVSHLLLGCIAVPLPQSSLMPVLTGRVFVTPGVLFFLLIPRQ